MSITWAAMLLWPLICIALYRNLSLPAALCISILGGYLLLPSAYSYDLPLLPPLNRDSVPTLSALIMTAIALQQRSSQGLALPGWLPRNRISLFLLLMLFGGIFGTVLTNGEPLYYGRKVIQGLRLYDAFSMLMGMAVFIAPLFLARKVLASPEGQRTLLLVVAISGMIYCLPTLYEVRMSPQLHIQIYGYFPHSFLQAVRGGGFRPSVFLGHGLELAIFLVMALLAAAGLYRASKTSLRSQFLMMVGFIFATLVLAKSLGALVIALFVLPVTFLAKQRTQLIFAVCIATAVLVFPFMRSAELVPTNSIIAAANAVNPIRAGSLSFRFFHEDKLLEKARRKPVFGWGEWSRNRVYNEYGRDVSVTDGAWIVHFGVGGWARYLGVFGLLCWSIIGLLFTRRENVDPVCAALALLLAAKLLDLIPNGAMPPFVWLVAGSLLGRLEMRIEAGQFVDRAYDVATVPKLDYRRTAPVGPIEQPSANKLKYARTFEKEEKEAAKPERLEPRKSYRRSGFKSQ